MSVYSLKGKRVWVAGHKGMVGSALVRRLETEECADIITIDRSELDLINQNDVENWLIENKPDVVVIAAAKVGGIMANATYPAEFLHQNLVIASNVIHSAYLAGVEKLLFLGSSCIYPKYADQPIKESSLLTGSLESTNEWYAIAKIAGIKLCEAYRRQYGCDFISAMPTNLYGPGDNYHLTNSHVIPALIRKAHMAKLNESESMEIWGSGIARREFMHADDCADALVFILKHISDFEHVNIGSGKDITIENLATTVMDVVGYDGALTKDLDKPDGTPRKIMDNTKLSQLGWRPSISLLDGLKDAYKSFLDEEKTLREV